MTFALSVIAHLQSQGVEHCVIGACALSSWGFTRFTTDFDVLTTNARVLDKSFWSPPELATRIDKLRRGDASDPLVGVVRFKPPDALDIVVSRDALMREAVANAVMEPMGQWRVATPLYLALMKMEAGGHQDLADVYRLVKARRLAEPSADLVGAIRARIGDLSDWGKRSWERLRDDLEQLDADPRSGWATFVKGTDGSEELREGRAAAALAMEIDDDDQDG